MSKKNKKSETKEKKPLTLRDVAFKVIIFCLVGIILVSGYNVVKTLYGYAEARQEYKKIEKIALVDPTKFTGEIDWAALREVCPDIAAWIYLKGTIVNYPVVKAADNDYYLHRLIDGSYSFAGTLFVDCHAEDDFRGFNTVIYGHHMKDGSMFASIGDYYKKGDYYDGHKVFELVTPYEKYHLYIFSAFMTDATGDVYTQAFYSEEAMSDFIDMLRYHSVVDGSAVEVSTSDRLVTLSTCVDAEGDARYVAVGKLVPWTDEEKEEAKYIQSTLD